MKWNFELTVFELTVPDLYLQMFDAYFRYVRDHATDGSNAAQVPGHSTTGAAGATAAAARGGPRRGGRRLRGGHGR